MTTLIQRTVQVSFRHQIFFTRGLFQRRNPLLRDIMADGNPSARRKVLVVVDEALSLAQPRLAASIESYFGASSRSCELVCSPVVIEGGERTKNSYFHVSEIQSLVDRFHIDRHSYIIAIGGGALLDMVGLAAATAHRGVRHIRLPTTTLAQNDSGVGVKNGINAFGKKNFIGSFAPPFAVVNDFLLLKSCPPRDRRAGSEAKSVQNLHCCQCVSFFEVEYEVEVDRHPTVAVQNNGAPPTTRYRTFARLSASRVRNRSPSIALASTSYVSLSKR